MIFLARLGALEAVAGFFLGLWLWKTLNRPQRFLAAFLGLSGALGVLAASLRIAGFRNAWVGDLWELVILCTLFQSLLLRCAVDARNLARLTQLFMIGTWIAYFFATGRWGGFSSGFHVSVCIVGIGLAGYVAIKDRANPSSSLLAWAVIGAFIVDILPHSASIKWLGLGDIGPRTLWTYRNAIWCLVYACMGYSLTLKDCHED